jgi:hypothetical protein
MCPSHRYPLGLPVSCTQSPSLQLRIQAAQTDSVRTRVAHCVSMGSPRWRTLRPLEATLNTQCGHFTLLLHTLHAVFDGGAVLAHETARSPFPEPAVHQWRVLICLNRNALPRRSPTFKTPGDQIASATARALISSVEVSRFLGVR